MSELDERNERIRVAYVERAARDRRELESWAQERPLTDDERAALYMLGAGYRLMPDAREKLGLTAPLRIRENGERAKARRRRR